MKNYQKLSIYFRCVIFSFYVMCIIGVIPQAVRASLLVDRVVAVVNEDVILLSDLNQSARPLEDRVKAMEYPPSQEIEMIFRAREQVLQKLIDEKLTDQETKKANISVSDKDIDAAIENIKQIRSYTDEQLLAALKNEGLTLKDYREHLKSQILRTRLVNYQIKSKIIITPEDIRQYYESNEKKYGGSLKYRLRNIFMAVPAFASEMEKAETRQKMDNILIQIANGESFEDLARQYSQAPGANDGGLLGEFDFKDIAPRVQMALKGMDQGEYTPVLDTEQGYQIFYVDAITADPPKTLEEAAPEIQDYLYNQVVDEKFRAWITQLRDQAHIKIMK
jgi:peptidyl-prolyl cis-trans isomerase SurA